MPVRGGVAGGVLLPATLEPAEAAAPANWVCCVRPWASMCACFALAALACIMGLADLTACRRSASKSARICSSNQVCRNIVLCRWGGLG